MATARLDNIVNKARKRGDAANEEGNHSTPVGSPFLRVAVDAVEVVHVRHRDFAASENVVAEEGLEPANFQSITIGKG